MFQRENQLWQAVVQNLAKELATPVYKLEQMLGAEAAELERVARIKHFVPLLAAKRVKERLRLAHSAEADT